MADDEPPRRKLFVYGTASIVILVVGLTLLGSRKKNELRMCASALLYMPHAASKEFYELERMGSAPSRDKLREAVNGKEFQARTKGCPKAGKIEVQVATEGSLNDDRSYSARCTIHGDLEALRKALGDEEFKKVQDTVKVGSRFL
ncbi:MAG: hypothetical protein HY815_00140 [Candidatus Riflebacteria bacterium]|nr:hypothetical protein [Candidatus Riflebacteria bacterium]